MTTINLLPLEFKKKKAEWQQRVVAVLIIGLGIFCAFSLYSARKIKLISLQTELTKIQGELNRLQPILQEVKTLSDKKAELQRRKDILTQLTKDRLLWPHLLEEMVKCVPEEGVWLQSFTSSGNTLTLSGTALNNLFVANFMVNLMNNPYFEGVELSSISSQVLGKSSVRPFSISCSFKRL